MRNALLVSIALAAVSLGACSTIKETVAGPQLAPMGYPAGMTPQTLAIVPQPAPQPASPSSAFRFRPARTRPTCSRYTRRSSMKWRS